MATVRCSIKAIIIEDGRLLLTRCHDGEGVFYLLPGGGQEHGETMHEALRRECREEISCEIELSELICIREYLGRDPRPEMCGAALHQDEFYFAARLAPGARPGNGNIPDDLQDDVVWVPLAALPGLRVYPEAIKRVIPADGICAPMGYLGAVD